MNTLHGERDFADVMKLRIVEQIILAYADEANLITKVFIWKEGQSQRRKWTNGSRCQRMRDGDSLLLVSRPGKKLRVQRCRQSLEAGKVKEVSSRTFGRNTALLIL